MQEVLPCIAEICFQRYYAGIRQVLQCVKLAFARSPETYQILSLAKENFDQVAKLAP